MAKKLHNEEIHKRIKNRRDSLNLSQDFVAQRIGICRNSVVNIESKTQIVNERIWDLADVLETSVSYLLLGIEDSGASEKIAELEAQKRALTDSYEQKLFSMQQNMDLFKALVKSKDEQINALRQINEIQSRQLDEK